jgi:hypothetical protein
MRTKPDAPNPAGGHETSDVNVRSLAYFGGVLFLVLVLTLISMRWVFFHFAKSQPLGPPPTPFENARTLPPAPRLQVEPRLELEHYRQEQQRVLTSYGWVDRPNGIVRIPIDRAMTLLLERGLPVRTQGAPAGETAGKSEPQRNGGTGGVKSGNTGNER